MSEQKADRILLVIDVQTCFFEGKKVVPDGQKLLTNIQKVVNRAREAKPTVKIIWVRHGEPGDADFEPNTPPWQIKLIPNPGEPIIDKTVPNSFHETTLADDISKIVGDQQPDLTLVGLQSEYCIDATSKAALERYPKGKIAVVTDAHGTYDDDGKTAAEISASVTKELEEKGAKLLTLNSLPF